MIVPLFFLVSAFAFGLAAAQIAPAPAARQAAQAAGAPGAPDHSPASPDSVEPAVTYSQIAPILAQRCAGCHSPEGGAPFNLRTYADAKQWGEQILEVTQSRYMPPWLPAPGPDQFLGERRLSDAQLDAIRRWVGADMPEGSGSAAGQPVRRPDAASAAAKARTAGKPGLTMQLEKAVALPGSGPDLFLNLVLPYTGQSRAIRAIEIRASDPQAVRSLWIQVDPAATLRKAHPAHWQDGIPGMEPPLALQSRLTSPGSLLFWTPDAPLLTFGPGQVWKLASGSDLVLSTHFKTTGRSENIQLTVALYFTPAVAGGQGEVIELAHDRGLNIPAGESSYAVEDKFALPAPVRLQAIYPRAHFIAHAMEVYATLPNGQRCPLISIPRWDVDWQAVYRYKAPIALPRGAVIHWRYVYDNSSGNSHNPSDPPALVHAGDAPADEVDELWLELRPGAGSGGAAGWRTKLQKAAAAQRNSATAGPEREQDTPAG